MPGNGLGWGVISVIIIAAIFVIVTVYFAVTGIKNKPVSGGNALEGETGIATTDLSPEGKVLVNGEWWNARANETIPEGAKIKVVRIDGMMLTVVRAPNL
jgi:membrane-bound serine protease (ClpP class)